jgi:mono/diheme cytochrome c family protein
MRNWIGCTFGLALLVTTASAWSASDDQKVTFTKDVLPILQENCQVCHRPGGNTVAGVGAPMALITYEEVRPWAKAMADKVKAKEMPPWDATDATHGQFTNERSLTQAQIDTIVRWATTGAARGNPSDAPPVKELPDNDGWVMGKPDLEVYLEKPYFVSDDIVDVQPRFAINITKDMLPESRWIQAAECRPASSMVHHTFSTVTAPAMDGQPEEMFALVSAAAGEDPQQFPDGFGNLLRPGSVVNISMHYHKEAGPGTGRWDRSGVGIKFYPRGREIQHKVNWGPIGDNGIGNAMFEVPPNQSDWPVGWSGTFDSDTLLLSLHPHMHYRGKSMKYTAYYPDGTTEMLLDVDRYNFAWQTIYFYKTPKRIPAGTRIDAVAIFDNSVTAKAAWPEIETDKPVRFGEASTDEMMIPYVSWTHVDPKDDQKYRENMTAMRKEVLKNGTE